MHVERIAVFEVGVHIAITSSKKLQSCPVNRLCALAYVVQIFGCIMNDEYACNLALLYQSLSLRHKLFGTCGELRTIFQERLT